MIRRSAEGLEAHIKQPSELDGGEIASWLRCKTPTPSLQRAFLAPGFARACEAAQGGVRVAVLRDGAGICAFLAFQFRSRWHAALGAAEGIGGGLTDHAGLVARAGFHIAPGLLLRLCGLGSLFLRQVSPAQAAFGLTSDPAGIGHLIDIAAGPAAYFEALALRDRAFVLDTERRARRMAREFGDIRHVAMPDPPAEAVEEVIAAKRIQYGRTGVGDPLSRPEARRLLLQLARQGGADCRLMLCSLHAGRHVLARHLGLMHGRTLSYWFPVYDAAARAVSPGRILLWHTIRDATALGITLIDRGGGDTQAKRDFSTGTVRFGVAHYTTPSLRGRIAHVAQAAAWRIGV